MKKLYYVELSYKENDFENSYINEYDEEIIKMDDIYIFTKNRGYTLPTKNFKPYYAKDINENVKPEESCGYYDNDNFACYTLTLFFIYDENDENLEVKKQIVRKIVIEQFKKDLFEKIVELKRKFEYVSDFIEKGKSNN